MAAVTEAMVAQLGKDLGQAQLIDTHAHINVEHFAEDRDAVVERAAQAGLSHIVNMGDSMESSQSSVALTKIYPMVYTGVGIHPEEAHPMTQADEDQLAGWGALPKVVAIGEIGLDYYWEKDPDVQKNQRDWFVRQMELAREVDLPVIIHSRDAAEDTLTLMKELHAENIPGVIHCYSYSPELAQEYVKMGYYIGVGGVVTFKNAKKLVQAVAETPMEHILLETDSPYLAPEPHRGHRNDSRELVYVVEKIAEIKGITPEEVEDITWDNALRLFQL